MLKLSPNDVIISEKSVVDLFHDGIRAEATRYDYTNKLKKVLCEYLGDILHGDPKKIQYQKNHAINVILKKVIHNPLVRLLKLQLLFL